MALLTEFRWFGNGWLSRNVTSIPLQRQTQRESWPSPVQCFQTQFYVDRGDKKRKILRQYLSTSLSIHVCMHHTRENRAVLGQWELKKACTLNSFYWDFSLQMQIGGRYSGKGKRCDWAVNMSDGCRINNIINLHFITVAAVIAEGTFYRHTSNNSPEKSTWSIKPFPLAAENTNHQVW